MRDPAESRTRELKDRIFLIVTLFGGIAQILALLAIIVQVDKQLPQWFVYFAVIFVTIGMFLIAVCLIPLCIPYFSVALKRSAAVLSLLLALYLTASEERMRLNSVFFTSYSAFVLYKAKFL